MNIIRHYSRAVMTLRVRNIKSLEYAFVKGKWVWCWVLDRYHRLRDPLLPRLTQAHGSDNVLLRLHYGHNLGFKYSGLRVSLFIICQLVLIITQGCNLTELGCNTIKVTMNTCIRLIKLFPCPSSYSLNSVRMFANMAAAETWQSKIELLLMKRYDDLRGLFSSSS